VVQARRAVGEQVRAKRQRWGAEQTFGCDDSLAGLGHEPLFANASYQMVQALASRSRLSQYNGHRCCSPTRSIAIVTQQTA
jgi:hypothetical protein